MAETKLKSQAINPSHIINAPEGFLINGKIVPSVSSNNLTVALKTLAGNDPSASDPIYIRIGDNVRTITTSLSVTLNAGTNWFNAGSSGLATKEIDYFVYLGWEATASAVRIGFGRIPYAERQDDYNSTNTDEKHIAFNDALNAGDSVRVIGRFPATLSASASYNWSVPTFTATNLIQRPIFKTRRLKYVPTLTTTGTMTVSTSTVQCYYQVESNLIWYQYSGLNNLGGTLSYAIFYTLPFTMVASDAGSGENQSVASSAGQHSNGGVGVIRFDYQESTKLSMRNVGGNYGSGTTWHDFSVYYPIA